MLIKLNYMRKKLVIVSALVATLALSAGYFVGYDIGYEKAVRANIDSFEDCAAAGYPIMESYPEQCAVPGGKSFTKSN